MSERNGTVVCPGSYDPVTNGHLDIITRTSNVFERVVVGVVNNPVRKQKTLFTAEERRAFIEEATSDMENVRAHEEAITRYALEGLASVRGLTVLGPQRAELRGGAVSFEIEGIHPHDVSQVLDSRGIAVRAGHHCAKPAHRRFGVQSSTRMSSYLYTTPGEIDALVDGLEYARSYFKVD